jgi:hypothetical protein
LTSQKILCTLLLTIGLSISICSAISQGEPALDGYVSPEYAGDASSDRAMFKVNLPASGGINFNNASNSTDLQSIVEDEKETIATCLALTRVEPIGDEQVTLKNYGGSTVRLKGLILTVYDCEGRPLGSFKLPNLKLKFGEGLDLKFPDQRQLDDSGGIVSLTDELGNEHYKISYARGPVPLMSEEENASPSSSRQAVLAKIPSN